ncbi:MAG: dTMP kinase [Verrucomicrobiales bacterium]|nr:dTMP kinase [Verrucomicrobiales bacterium]
MNRGVFISFEGSEGCGKSTQIARLESRLAGEGHEVLRTREPGGTVLGEHVRKLLQHTPEVENMTPESELFLFAASRAQLVREKIRPALEAGTWVIADRFLDSTTVYQGIGRGLGVEEVNAMNSFAIGDTKPQLTILLDLDAETGHQRAVESGDDGPDRMENQPMEFFETVRNGYLELAKQEPDRIAVIDASKSIEEVEAAIWAECEGRLKI